LNQEFVKLETEPANLELLKSIFRTIHTSKGTCCQGRGRSGAEYSRRGAGGAKHLARSHRVAESGKAAQMSTHLRELVGRFKLDTNKRATNGHATKPNKSSHYTERSEQNEGEFATK
jgi:hypothetical protein